MLAGIRAYRKWLGSIVHEPLPRRTSTGSPWRDRASLAAACGIHTVALLAITWKRAPPPLPQAPGEPESVDQWEIDVPAPEERGESSNEPAAGTPEAVRRPVPPSREPPFVGDPAPSPSGSAAPPGEPWAFSPTAPKTVDLGLGPPRGAARWAPGTTTEAGALPQPSRSGGLLEALDAADTTRGLGRAGPVKLAVEEAARTTDAPPTGKANFDISIDREGAIHIHLASASSDFEGWNRIVGAIRTQLARKRVRIPPGAKGLHVVVEVEAKEQYPDGTSPSSFGTKVGMGPLGPSVSYRGKICSGVITLGGIGGSCGPENIGVHPARMVSSRIVEETRW